VVRDALVRSDQFDFHQARVLTLPILYSDLIGKPRKKSRKRLAPHAT
jgi:hypothetical protein